MRREICHQLNSPYFHVYILVQSHLYAVLQYKQHKIKQHTDTIEFTELIT
jgi:hypothetical protein